MSRRNYTAEDAREALQHCDPGTDRHQWVRILAAAKDAGVPFDEALTWSASAPNFTSERDVQAAWKGIAPGAVKAGTLYHEARARGWKPRQAGELPRSEHRAPAPAPRPVEPARPPRWSAAEVWEASEPATAAHPYVIRKNGNPEGLRTCAKPVRIGGADMAGALLVPVRTLAGELVSLQCIPAEGPKKNLPGHPMRGVHIVGELLPDGLAYVCEGIGQAWACWQATGRAAVVAFGWGRVQAVTGELLALHRSLRLVLVPDAGKEADARAIAEASGCQWVELPEGSPPNFDVNDYAAQHGGEGLGELLEHVQSPPVQEPPPPRFRLLTPENLRNLPALRWRVKGVLPAVGVAAVFGPSGSGKSFLCFDLAAAVASGQDWFAHRVKPAPVVYIPLEGEAGFRLRADAWEAEQGRRMPDGLALVMDPFKLTDPEDVAALAEVVSATGHEPVVIVDTLNRSAPDCDENASADMGRVIEGAKSLQRLTGGLVILVHHTGKDAGKGMRGHSSLFAALDAAIEVTREDDRRAWKGGKVKDGEDGKAHPFRLQVHELGEDDDGDLITSCAVRPDDSADVGEVQRPRHPKGGNQRIVLDALLPLFKAGTAHGKGGALSTLACIDLEAAITAGAACLACEKERRRERARLAVTGLISAGVLGCGEGWLWLK